MRGPRSFLSVRFYFAKEVLRVRNYYVFALCSQTKYPIYLHKWGGSIETNGLNQGLNMTHVSHMTHHDSYD